jgi:NhaP-type Na+/H+ or K+/H+ antiporter
MKPSSEYVIYLIGVLALGLGYGPVKSALGGHWLFLLCVLAYLIALRFLGVFVARRGRAKGYERSDAQPLAQPPTRYGRRRKPGLRQP